MSTSETSQLTLNQPRAARRKWLTPLVGLAIWLGTVMTISAVISMSIWRINATSIPTSADLDSWLWKSRDAKLAALREVYNGTPDFGDEQCVSIEKFLQQGQAGQPAADEVKWIKLIDANRFRARIMRCPWMNSINILQRQILAEQPVEHFSVDDLGAFHEIKIVRVVPWGRGGNTIGRPEGAEDLVLAYGLGSRTYSESEPLLFWLADAGGQWKLVDWEFVDSGSSESESAALLESASQHRLANGFREMSQYLRAADATRYADEDEFRRQLKKAEGCQLPPQIEELGRYMLINRWSNRDNPDEVRRLQQQVKDPDRMPGFHLIEIKVCEKLGDSENALAKIAHLEQLIGLRPQLIKSRAKLLEWSDRRDDAVVQWRRVVEFEPDVIWNLNELSRLLPDSQRDEIVQQIKKSREPVKLAYQFASYGMHRLKLETLRELAAFVKEKAPGSLEDQGLEVQCLVKNNDHVAAAELYRQSAERGTDQESQDRDWTAYFRQMSQAGRIVEAFKAHPNPARAFQMLMVRDDDDDDRGIDDDQLPIILDVLRQKASQDPWIQFYDGKLAADQQRFEEARRIFAALDEWLPDLKKNRTPDGEKTEDGQAKSDDESDSFGLESLEMQLRYQRCRVEYELGEDVETLEHYKGNEAAYNILSNLAHQYQHWDTLDRLNQTFARTNPNNPWLFSNQTRVLIARRKFDEARHKLRSLASREAKEAWLKYTRESLEREISEAETPVRTIDLLQGVKSPAVFKQLSRELLQEQNWDKLDQLCANYSESVSDPEFKNVQLEQAWRRSDDDRFIQLMATRSNAAKSYAETTWREREVRSLMRLGRQAEADQKAVGLWHHFGQHWPLVLTLVNKQDVAGLTTLLESDEQLASAWEYHDFFQDPILRKVLVDDAFESMRQGKKISLPLSYHGELVVLLLREPMVLNEELLGERLTSLATGQKPLQVTQVSSDKWIVDQNRCRFLVVASAEPYFSLQMVNDRLFDLRKDESPEETSGVFKEQTAYVQIVPILMDNDEPWDAAMRGIREIGSLLLNPKVAGVATRDRIGTRLQVVRLEPSQLDLPTSDALSEARLNGKGRLIRENYLPPSLTAHKRQQLTALASGKEPISPSTTATIQLCAVPRLLTIPVVVNAIRLNYGQVELVVEYQGDSPAPIPELRRGLSFTVSLDQVADVTIP